MTHAEFLDSLAGVDAGAFDALGAQVVPATCHERLLRFEADRRWRAGYLSVTAEDGTLVAAVPFHHTTAPRWPDPAYDPRSWGFDASEVPGSYLFVGGVTDLRADLHVEDARIRETLRKLAQRAAGDGQALCLPYVGEGTHTQVSAALGDLVHWVALGEEADFSHHLGPEPEPLGSRVRGVLNRDRRLIEKAQVETGISTWPAVASHAAEVIADHNDRKGKPDHPEFVELRYEEWCAFESVEVLVFTARAAGCAGYLTALRRRGGLDLHLQEIGLTGQEGPERIAVYVSLLYHQPMAFARDQGLRVLTAGIAARTPKASRGARFRPLYGGLMDAAAVRAFAGAAA
ncbi:hypothetical protein KDL01_16730 [Actinospica durhamensis]|uniref:BioF2-like acetyltransferase domain-containing protein n=1 Tax=Actinospica durhamensis TaxID=1508375 RepID=A0A941EPS3_9ACTN|nr:hypothetical protein [Actinospica durhamensis]MBR7834921.1 hypothetical protein [Actinospica durhamensis]